MFNLNIPASSLLNIDGSGLCSTPKTPEIVNSLIAMTNPMDNYNFAAVNNHSGAYTPGNGAGRSLNGCGNSGASQDSSHSSCSASPLDSPAGGNSTTPSVQQTCSQLIKAGLKLSIQSKRKLSTCDSSSGSEQPNSKCARRDEDADETTDDDCESKSIPKGLTPEDEDRRRRRRERNKIAATKCRMKKRERTQNLIKESEILDTQNVVLKNQVRTLEAERRKLIEILQVHAPTCLRGFSLPSKFQQSPAHKYLADLQLEDNLNATNTTTNNNNSTSNVNGLQSGVQMNGNGACSTPQRTAIPPMSTIKFSRSNGFKAAAAAVTPQLHQVSSSSSSSSSSGSTSSPLLPHTTTQLPNGYCKPSPTPQELGYLNSPSQDTICLPNLSALPTLPTLPTLPSLPTHQSAAQQRSPTADPTATTMAAVVSHQLPEYIPNCDNSLGLSGLVHTSTGAVTPTNNGGDNSVLLGGVPSPLTCISTPTTATEFVKNELVDSQSPYTTAQSAERFLFETNCDSFVDIKHAVSVIPSNNNNNSIVSLTHVNNNNNNNLLDFHTTLLGAAASSFHDQLSIKNDYLNDADLLALTADAAEFVDLDTGVAAAFMANGGCLA